MSGVGIPNESTDCQAALAGLIEPGEEIVFVGSQKLALTGAWTPLKQFEICQYVWNHPSPLGLSEQAVDLYETDLPAMLELTSLVYPAYFRKGTAQLAQYIGIKIDGRLAAMAGIRMSFPGFQELSAICTHPDFRGRGLASQLTLELVRRILSEGDLPFLHTETDNTSAQRVYENVGFALRTVLPCKVLQRQ